MGYSFLSQDLIVVSWPQLTLVAKGVFLIGARVAIYSISIDSFFFLPCILALIHCYTDGSQESRISIPEDLPWARDRHGSCY